MGPDGELLRSYVDGSDAAFAELVQRHINVVYRTALRRVGGNAHAADDVTQRVFTALARKAPSLRDHASLVGWLYTSTRFAAAETVRAEQRRRKHEQEAHTMHELNSPAPSPEGRIEPLLDEVMERLPPRDRELVILHFLEGRSFVEIAAAMSSTADATRMRVNRALDRLRAELARHGVTSTAAALGAVLSAESTIAAPASLASSVAAAAVQQAATLAGGVTVAVRVVALVKSWPWIVGSAAVIAIATTTIALQPLASKHADSPAQTQRADRPAEAASEPVPSTLPSASARVTSTASVVTATPAQGVVAGQSRFAALSPEEKNILAILWRQQERLPRVAGIGWGIKVGDHAPNSRGVAPLMERGWIASTEAKGVLHLTPRGRLFCETYATEIKTYAGTTAESN